ncbi:MAG TPA: hypothetical protein PKC67_10655 [Kiritimatiellia bacterium]|nr:hypothetical protein [Kiritimatiellia bacterium]HMP34800.1 hypothetical protein [Kiritimatiellia bacterium]
MNRRFMSIAAALLAAAVVSANAQQTRSAPPPQQQVQFAGPRATDIQPYDSEGNPNPDAFEWSGFALGLKVGTLGIGADASIYLSDWVSFRGNVGYLDFTYKDTIDDIDFDLDLNFQTAMFLLDFYPFEGGNFRISAGVALLDNELGIDGTPEGNEEIGDNEYTPEQIGTISGAAEFDEVAPYIGIGYGNAVRPDYSLTFVVDFGVIFQTYDVSISSSGTAANDPTFQQDLAQLQKDIEDEINRLKIYPVINFGIAYHF